MAKKPIRKRFVVKKRHKEGAITFSPVCCTTEGGSPEASGSGASHNSTEESDLAPCGVSDFDSECDDQPRDRKNNENSNHETIPYNPPMDLPVLMMTVKGKLDVFLHQRFMSIVGHDSIQVMQISPHNNRSIQRTAVFLPSGEVKLYVHRKEICVEPYLPDNLPIVPLQSETVDAFVDRAVVVINNVRSVEICSGFDDQKFKTVWSGCPFGDIDSNPYDESRYCETFRSTACSMLVKYNKWKCNQCAKLYYPLRRRLNSARLFKPHENTPNIFLSEANRLKKLEEQKKEKDYANKKLSRLKERMDKLIKEQGIMVDNILAGDLTGVLKDANITPAQHIFLQQQVKASQKKNMVGMRWHPTMIRFALSFYITSPAAYEMVRDTGMVKLPSSRTLFDYSHVKPLEDGVDSVVVESLAERVTKLEDRRKYHVLMADEVHISQNLVFQKSNGRMVGYTKLDEIDKEIKNMNHYLDNPSEEISEAIASKALVYMVKGVSVGIKAVVATFPVANPSAQQLYVWTWQVIGALERSGIPIIVFVCDGFSVNRAFIKMHAPVTVLPSGVIFDTVNKAARHRILFFVSDVPHLLKTLRNCFMNSRWDNKKSRRHMMCRGKKISWDFIIKLYESQKKKSLRKTFKLNAMNVYPDSYARMKVKYAAEIISHSVAQHLKDQKWADASETISFITLFNDWFDCLNGAHSSMGKRRRNSNLNPYRRNVLGPNPTDERFQFLKSVLQYLEEWKIEAFSDPVNQSVNCSVVDDPSGDDHGSNEESAIFEGADDANCHPSRRILSRETMEGIEMSTNAIMSAVTFLLGEGVDYINPRVFTQDPLEQHFSKIRAGQGGSTNPNFLQLQNRNRAVHTVGEMGVRKRKCNSGENSSEVVVTTAKLPKRKSDRGAKFWE